MPMTGRGGCRSRAKRSRKPHSYAAASQHHSFVAAVVARARISQCRRFASGAESRQQQHGRRRGPRSLAQPGALRSAHHRCLRLRRQIIACCLRVAHLMALISLRWIHAIKSYLGRVSGWRVAACAQGARWKRSGTADGGAESLSYQLCTCACVHKGLSPPCRAERCE